MYNYLRLNAYDFVVWCPRGISGSCKEDGPRAHFARILAQMWCPRGISGSCKEDGPRAQFARILAQIFNFKNNNYTSYNTLEQYIMCEKINNLARGLI